ncbi:hypothetical protein D9M70_470770 [compost metagenome]
MLSSIALEHHCGPIGPYWTSINGLVLVAAAASAAEIWTEGGAYWGIEALSSSQSAGARYGRNRCGPPS